MNLIYRADQGHHASGDSVVAAVGEKLFGVGEGAAVGGVNFVCGESDFLKLELDGGAEIDAAFAIWIARDGGAIAEEGIENLKHFAADLEGGGADAGADGGDEIDVWGDSAELLDGAGDDAGDDAAPAGVNGGDGRAVFRGEQDRGAVGNADGGELVRLRDDDGVGVGVNVERFVGSGDGNRAAVHLMDAKNGSIGDLKRGLDAAIVFAEVFGRILWSSGGVAKVEGIEGRRADAADAGGEGVGDFDGGEERGFVPDGEAAGLSAKKHGGRLQVNSANSIDARICFVVSWRKRNNDGKT